MCRFRLAQGLDQFQLRFQRTVDAKMDKLEEYAMRNIFHVPEDLCVLDAPEDADAALGSPQPVSVLDEELQELADNIAQAVAVRRALVGELKQAQLQMAAHVQYAPALAPIAPLVPEAGLDDNSVRLRTALHTLERNANALDQIREKVVERLARGAPDGGRDGACCRSLRPTSRARRGPPHSGASHARSPGSRAHAAARAQPSW